ncbi:MAG: flagellar assembly protein FliX [Salinarimonas sp.]|nr:flagellar assembly protein FliX [Salinarimonas sp.]
MRIDPKTNASPIAAAAARRRTSGASFDVADTAASRPTSGAAAPAAAGSLDALLALQEESGDGERRRRTARRGHDLLDALDRLKAALLGGRVPVSDLKAIAARLAERRDLSGDPRLDEIVAHIELRAQVELAKLGSEPAGSANATRPYAQRA